MATIFGFGGHTKIIKISYSSIIVYPYVNKHFDIYITQLCKSIMSSVMFVLRFWAASLDFFGHIKISQIVNSNTLDTYLNNGHFDILHDFISQSWTQVCLFYGFWWPSLFLAAFWKLGLIFPAKRKHWCIHYITTKPLRNVGVFV